MIGKEASKRVCIKQLLYTNYSGHIYSRLHYSFRADSKTLLIYSHTDLLVFQVNLFYYQALGVVQLADKALLCIINKIDFRPCFPPFRPAL